MLKVQRNSIIWVQTRLLMLIQENPDDFVKAIAEFVEVLHNEKTRLENQIWVKNYWNEKGN